MPDTVVGTPVDRWVAGVSLLSKWLPQSGRKLTPQKSTSDLHMCSMCVSALTQ